MKRQRHVGIGLLVLGVLTGIFLAGCGGFSSSGLPIGLQIAGENFAEGRIFQVAHAYEQAARWFERRPPLEI